MTLYSRLLYLFIFVTASICLAASAPAAEDISIEVDRIQYSDAAGRVMDYDFISGTLTGGNITLPGSAYSTPFPTEEPFLLKGYRDLGGYDLTGNSLWFCVPQVPNGGSQEYHGLFYLQPQSGTPTLPINNPAEWTVSVKNLQFATRPQHVYEIRADISTSTNVYYQPDNTQASYSAFALVRIYTGISLSSGKIYDCLVYGRVFIYCAATGGYWPSRYVYFARGIDPASMTLDIKLEVPAPDTISGSCSLNGGDWVDLGTVQVSEADIRPLGGLVPSVGISSFYWSPEKTIVIDGLETEVLDFYYYDKLFSTWITECALGAGSHQGFVDCISREAETAKYLELISRNEERRILNCAEQADIP